MIRLRENRITFSSFRGTRSYKNEQFRELNLERSVVKRSANGRLSPSVERAEIFEAILQTQRSLTG